MEKINGISLLRNEPLARHTTYRIGGPVAFLAFPEKAEHLRIIAEEIRKSGLPYFILGNGSNILAPDEGFPGWVIKTSQLNTEIRFSETTVDAGAACMNSSVLRAAAAKGLTGLEYLAGVPGTIGGAVAMNAGTASGWVANNLQSVKAYSLTRGELAYAGEELTFSYREQHFLPQDAVILSAVFSLKPADPELIKKSIAESIQKRKQAQPIELPSCGSVFRNPSGHQAWKLIADAGLRGKKIGGARISEKHTNFIVNEGGATRADVLALIALAKEQVLAHSGIALQEEVIVFSGKLLI